MSSTTTSNNPLPAGNASSTSTNTVKDIVPNRTLRIIGKTSILRYHSIYQDQHCVNWWNTAYNLLEGVCLVYRRPSD